MLPGAGSEGCAQIPLPELYRVSIPHFLKCGHFKKGKDVYMKRILNVLHLWPHVFNLYGTGISWVIEPSSCSLANTCSFLCICNWTCSQTHRSYSLVEVFHIGVALYMGWLKLMLLCNLHRPQGDWGSPYIFLNNSKSLLLQWSFLIAPGPVSSAGYLLGPGDYKAEVVRLFPQRAR